MSPRLSRALGACLVTAVALMGSTLAVGAQTEDEQASIDELKEQREVIQDCLLYTSPSPRDATLSRMPSSA